MTNAVHDAAAKLIGRGMAPRRWKPLRDNVIVERLDMGRETVTKGGIVLPATLGSRAKTKSDMWRGKVLAVGPEVRDLVVGDHVLVHTWAEGDGSVLYTGIGLGAHRFIIKPNDIACVVDADAEVTWRQADAR